MAGKYRIGASVALDGEKEFRTSINSINAELKKFSSEMKKMSAQYSGSSQKSEELNAKYQILGKTLDAQKEKVSATAAQLEKTKAAFAAAGEKVEKLEEKLNAARSELERMTTSGEASKEEIAKQNDEISKLESQLSKAEKSYERAGISVTNWETKLNQAETEVIKTERELESLNDEIGKLNSESGSSISQFIAKIQNMGKSIGAAFNSATSAVEKISKAMQPAKDKIAEFSNKILESVKNSKTFAPAYEAAASKIKAVSESFQAAKAKITDFSQKITDSVKNSKAFTSASQGITSKVSALGEKFKSTKSKITEFAEKITNSVKNSKTFNTVAEKTKSVVENVKNKFKGLGNEVDDAGKKTSTFGETLKGVLSAELIKSGLNAVWGAVKRIGQAFVNVGKQAIELYSNYEQLVGGVETLFGKSKDVVIKYANNAYKTAGLSANEYMETVTGFSASLLQSLNGDTAKAAKIADMAISDMSDNANKMGTDMSSIQNAYQGFAKQNYTMLDNLKLGYGGTKEEMQRLLDDANKLNAQQGKHTKYSIKNYSDIINAIHDVQVNMGIYGTTAKEASTTIQGSLNATKAAWQNLLTGIADDNADFDMLINNFVDSVTTAGNNLLPRIEQTINGISKLIEKLAPVIIEKLPEIISKTAPGIINAAESLGIALFNALQTTISDIDWQGLGTKISDCINSIDWVTLFADTAKMLSDLLVDALDLLIGFTENLDWEKLGEDLINSLVSVVTNIDWSAVVSKAFELLGAALAASGELVLGLCDAVWNLLVSGFESTKGYFSKYIDEAGGNVIEGLFNGIINALANIGDWIYKNIFQPFINGFKNAFGIHSPSTVMREMGGYIVDGLVNGVKSLPTKVIGFFNDLKTKIVTWGTEVKTKIKTIGGDLIKGLWNGINDKVEWITKKIQGFGTTVIEKIKGIFGIHSPSKVMAEIGGYISEGLANGIKAKSRLAVNAMTRVSDNIIGSIPTDINVPVNGAAKFMASALNGGRQSVNITNNNTFNSASARDGDALIRQINRALGASI